MESIIKIAKEAWDIIISYFESSYTIETKIDTSLVTQADKHADAFISKKIQKLFPNDQIISEENLQMPDKTKNIRYVDPLDWTKDFINGWNTFSVIIWYVDTSWKASFWMIYFPLTQELVYTWKQWVIYEKKWHVKILNSWFWDSVYYKSSVFKYPLTNHIIQNKWNHKKEIRPSGFWMKEFLINNWGEYILWHWYIYELCSFDALVSLKWWSLRNSQWKKINYYQEKMKILWWCFMWDTTSILSNIT